MRISTNEQADVVRFDPALVAAGSLLLPLAFRPNHDYISVGSQAIMSSRADGRSLDSTQGFLKATNNPRIGILLTGLEVARRRLELPPGHLSFLFKGRPDPLIHASSLAVNSFRQSSETGYSGYLVEVPADNFEQHYPEQFGGVEFWTPHGIEGVTVRNVFGITVAELDTALGPQGFEGLADGVNFPDLWPIYLARGLRLDELPASAAANSEVTREH